MNRKIKQELTFEELKSENKNLRKNLELARQCFCESENKREQALEQLANYIDKWQGLCFDDVAAKDLMQICEVLNESKNT